MSSPSGARSWVRDVWWLPPALVLGTFGTVAGSSRGTHLDVSANPDGVSLFLLALGALVMWRRRPELSVVVNAVAVAAYFGLGNPDGPVYLTVPAAALVIGLQRPPRRWFLYVAGGAALIAAGLVTRLVTDETRDLRTLWQLAGVTALSFGAAAVGWALRNRRETQTERARLAATREQLRMAQDLHDGVGHGLAVIAMQAGVALHVLDREPAKARQSLEAIRDSSREALESLRRELARLSADESPPRVPRRGLADLGVLLDRIRAGGLAVQVSGDAGVLPGEVDAAAYAIVQEALTNVLRHADATRAVVGLGRYRVGPDGAELLGIEIHDDGRAVPARPAGDGQDGGMGISGMRARAERVGGRLWAGPGESGWSVRAELPVAVR